MSDKLTTKLIGLINNELQPSTASTREEDDVQVTSQDSVLTRPAWILGTCMNALQKRNHSEWATKVNICNWIRSGLKNWGTTPEVVAGLAPLARMRYVAPLPKTTDIDVFFSFSVTMNSIPLTEIYPHLRTALLSHSRVLRLNAMRLMDSKLVSASAGVQEVMKRCLQGEEVPCDVQGVRERVLRIGRVVHVVGDAEGADFCARWLIGVLFSVLLA
jgi:U3 small nucleolar RNA-associated protein 20